MDKLFAVKDKTILITGSSGGLGYFFAKGLASRGAKVILNGTNNEKLQKARHLFKAEGFETLAFPFDVTDSKAVNTAVQRITDEAGQIDVLVNKRK
jgi:gluconate 5-dehydrogenase